MYRKIFQVLSCALLTAALISCSDNADRNENEISYTVRRATQEVKLPGKWDEGQWKDADVIEIANYLGQKPDHFPKSQAKILYDDDNLYVFFKVEDQYVRAVAEQTHGKVWEDSCVEFFFTPGTDISQGYINIEII